MIALMNWYRWVKRVAAAAGFGLLIAVAAMIPAGCTTTIRAPAAVQDPVPVYLIDHGHTPSLIIPAPADADHAAARYAYGDWQYYAQARRNPIIHGLPALLWPTPAGVGRQSLHRLPQPDPDDVTELTWLGMTDLHVIEVERAHAEALHVQLEAHFAERWEERLENPGVRLTFVPHDDAYSLPHDSNRMVARWLKQMNVETSGPFWATEWRLENE